MNAEMVVREVEGWHLCTRDGAAFWVRDIELAERAGLARPRDIRKTIKAMIDEGAISSEILGATADRAQFYAEKTLVPIPGNKGHREVTEYLLNRKAALLVVMRLRTERAAELVDAIVTVFLRVVDGGLAGEELRALREDRASLGAELALVKGQLVKVEREVGELRTLNQLGSGVITGPQKRLLQSAKRRLAEGFVGLGIAPKLRSAHATIWNAMKAAIDWGGPGQRLELLPVAHYSRALAHLEGEEKRLNLFRKARERDESTAAQGNLFHMPAKPKVRA